MKIRNGFVSNSSSSSFIIGFKGSLTKEDFEKKIQEKFSISENHPLFKFVNLLIEQILSSVDLNNQITTPEEYLKEIGYDEMPEEDNLSFIDLDAISLLKEKWTILMGSFCDDYRSTDLTQIGFEFKDDNFCFYSEEGY
ncbi:MAG: hypothetical protein LBD41_07865 [Clostridiales Family XIII bacterium]|jgi:hypothetical protein|nr:hypothetical protein [Clostridiales Family XIII bacterium]